MLGQMAHGIAVSKRVRNTQQSFNQSMCNGGDTVSAAWDCLALVLVCALMNAPLVYFGIVNFGGHSAGHTGDRQQRTALGCL